MGRYRSPLNHNPLLKAANALYGGLHTYLQDDVDRDPDSGLEPEELPDGYNRLKGAQSARRGRDG